MGKKGVLQGMIGADETPTCSQLEIPSLPNTWQIVSTLVLDKMYSCHCPTDLHAMFPTRSGSFTPAYAFPMPAANTNSLDESFFLTADYYYLTFKVPVSRPSSAACYWSLSRCEPRTSLLELMWLAYYLKEEFFFRQN